jgi:hypothetical protein
MSTNHSLSSEEIEKIRAGWHTMRNDYHALVGEIPPVSLRSRTIDTRWSIAEILTHMILSVDLVPQEIEAVRKGKDFLNVPPLIATTVNLVWVKFRARRATQQSLLDDYDRAFNAALLAWDGVRDDEWTKGANFFGEGYRTLTENYAVGITHFKEHADQIRKSIPVPKEAGTRVINTR